MKIAVVAGETSGDILGASLLQELKKRFPQAEFVGIAGPKMQAQGMDSFAQMDKLSIMGFDGLWGSLLDILSIRKRLIRHLLDNPPDVYIGIDVPDFNLTIEETLRAVNIPTVHYVSPTVWAWRKYRIHKIRRAVDLMLTLFPFEKDFYIENSVPVEYVGHPITTEISPQTKAPELRARLVSAEQRLLAVLPGSRSSEVKKLGALFVNVMRSLHQQDANVRFVVPIANPRVGDLFKHYLQDSDHAFISLVDGADSRSAMAAADVVLLASGTAALESALMAKPTVVAYKLSWSTYLLAKFTATVKHFSMPNHLLDEPIVPELMQFDATEENLLQAVQAYLYDSDLAEKTSQKLATIHAKLAYDSSRLAVDAIEKMLSDKAAAVATAATTTATTEV